MIKNINKIIFVFFFIFLTHAKSDFYDFLKEKGVLLDGIISKSEKQPCHSLERESPGTYYFSKTDVSKFAIVCYVDENGRIQFKVVKIKTNSVKFESDKKYLNFDDFFSKNSGKDSTLKQPWNELKPIGSDLLTTVDRLNTGSKRFSSGKICPSRLEKSDVEKTMRSQLESSSLPTCTDYQRTESIQTKETLTHGSYGEIRNVCISQNDCSWVEKTTVLKRGTVTNEKTFQEFLNEMLISKRLSSSITPEFKKAFLCREGSEILGKFIIKKMDMDLYTYLKTHPITQAQLEEIMKLIQQFHNLGFVHQDLHSKNILVKLDAQGTPHFFLNDFGLSFQFQEKNKEIISPIVESFMGKTGGETQDKQQIQDYVSIISDLKDKFGIEITLKMPAGAITPMRLPFHTQGNLLAKRAALVQIMADPKNQIKGGKWVLPKPIPGTPRVLEADPVLLSPTTKENLEKLDQMKGLVIDLR